MESIGKILENLLKRKKFGEEIQRHRIFEKWPEIVGPSLAEHARPQKIQGQTLFLEVDHPAWIQELQFLKLNLLKKIKLADPETRIEGLRFVLS